MNRDPRTKSRDDVRRIKQAAEDGLFAIPGVTGVDLVESPPGVHRIRIYVRRGMPTEHRAAIPKEIDGVECEVVEREYRPS